MISPVRSTDPSLTITQTFGKCVWEMTERIVSGLKNPHVRFMAHPTSRRILPVSNGIESGPIDVDIDAVFQAAAATNTILEINSMPSRLDLDATLARRARESGITLVINTDSHNTESLDNIALGVGIAREAGCRPSDIVNTLPLAELLIRLKKAR